MTKLALGHTDGSLTVRTGVTGTASRLGHRLELRFTDWKADIDVDAAGTPIGALVIVQVDSLRVVGAEGGITPLSPVDTRVVRYNAMKTLRADEHPTSMFIAEQAILTSDSLRLEGRLTIAGRTRPLSIDCAVAPWGSHSRLTAAVRLRQSDFGVQPYSLMHGALKVADEVEVSFDLHVGMPAPP